MTVETDGFYIIQSRQGSYAVEHFKVRTDYSHIVQRFIDGPFEDVVRGDKVVLSGYRVAHTKLSEFLAEVSDKGWIPSAKAETTA